MSGWQQVDPTPGPCKGVPDGQHQWIADSTFSDPFMRETCAHCGVEVRSVWQEGDGA